MKNQALIKEVDLFFNFVSESFKHKIAVFIFPYLKCNGMNDPGWLDSVCNEKTYLSHMFNISVCDKHTLSS